MAEYQNQKNIELWNMQNVYNTPSAQMERFKEAGLNPNLIYGKGTPGNAQPITPYQEDRTNQKISSVNVGNAVGNYFQNEIQDATAKTARAKARSAEAEAQRDEDMYMPTEGHYLESRYDPSTGKLNFQWNEDKMSNFMRKFNTDVDARIIGNLKDKSGMIKINTEIEGIEARTEFQKWENQIAKDAGLTKSDPMYARMLWNITTNNGAQPMNAYSKTAMATAEAVLRALGGLPYLKGLGVGAGKKKMPKATVKQDGSGVWKYKSKKDKLPKAAYNDKNFWNKAVPREKFMKEWGL